MNNENKEPAYQVNFFESDFILVREWFKNEHIRAQFHKAV